jgi:hypothetical protein
VLLPLCPFTSLGAPCPLHITPISREQIDVGFDTWGMYCMRAELVMTTPLRCGQYCLRRFLCVSEFSFSHVLAQMAAWNLIKIAHNVYLISLSRRKISVSFSANFRAKIDIGSNICWRSLNSINRIIVRIHLSQGHHPGAVMIMPWKLE